jgi:hypothetical protein
MHINIRSLGLMWSLFLIGHVSYSGVLQGLYLRMETKKRCAK